MKLTTEVTFFSFTLFFKNFLGLNKDSFAFNDSAVHHEIKEDFLTRLEP